MIFNVTKDNYQVEVLDASNKINVFLVYGFINNDITKQTLDFLLNQPDIKICFVDFDEQRELVQKNNIREVPTTQLFVYGSMRISTGNCSAIDQYKKIMGALY